MFSINIKINSNILSKFDLFKNKIQCSILNLENVYYYLDITQDFYVLWCNLKRAKLEIPWHASTPPPQLDEQND